MMTIHSTEEKTNRSVHMISNRIYSSSLWFICFAAININETHCLELERLKWWLSDEAYFCLSCFQTKLQQAKFLSYAMTWSTFPEFHLIENPSPSFSFSPFQSPSLSLSLVRVNDRRLPNPNFNSFTPMTRSVWVKLLYFVVIDTRTFAQTHTHTNFLLSVFPLIELHDI